MENKFKKIGMNTTVLLSSLSLAACGGGSGGYFGDTPATGGTTPGSTPGSTTGTQTAVKEAAGVRLSLDKSQLNVTGDTVQVTAIAVDKDGGGVAGKTINLNIANNDKNGATSDSSSKVTDATGATVFTVKLDGQHKDVTQLLLTATLQGTTINDIKQIPVVGTTTNSSDFYLTATTTSALDIRGGQTTLMVTAKDTNGGALANKDILLSLPNTNINGLTIQNGSSLKTNEKGQAQFVIQFDPSLATPDTIASLLKDGVVATATSGSTIRQITKVTFATVPVVVQSLDLVMDKGALVVNSTSPQIVSATVTATDPNGQPISGQKVRIALDQVALRNGVSLNGAVGSFATVTTNDKGQAVVSMTVNPNSSTAIDALVSNGIGLGASTVQGDGSAGPTQSTKITILSAATVNEVGYLDVDAANAISITGGKTTVTVRAMSSSGALLQNKNVSLKVEGAPAGLNISLDALKKATDAQGEAQFVLSYNAPASMTPDQIQALLKGLNLTASYLQNSGKIITQTTTVQFYNPQVNIERIDLVTDKNVLQLTAGTQQIIKATVTLKAAQGLPVANRQTTISITPAMLQNGVTLVGQVGGVAAITTDANGQAVISLNVNPANIDAVNTLLKTGLDITASALQSDGANSISQKVIVNTVSSAALDEVGYLTATASNSIATTGGISTITVKAFNSNGTALANKAVALNLANVPAGLTIKTDAASKTTDANGNAQFTVTYTAPAGLTAEQIKALIAGVQANAVYTNSAGKTVSQSTNVQFYIDSAAVAEDVGRIDLTPSKGVVYADSDTVSVSAKLYDKQGNALANKRVSLGLDQAATQNGVTISGPQTVQTDSTGVATFNVSIKALNDAMISNLTANGITLAVSALQADGTPFGQTVNVVVKSPENRNIATLVATPSNQVISALGGISTVGVKAVDANGQPLANKQITFSLAAGTSSRVTATPQTGLTNSQGVAYFTVNVAQGAIEDALVKDGITYAVSAYNESDTLPVTQVGKINISVPTEAMNLQGSASKTTLIASGDTAEVYAKLQDQTGAGISGYPVTFTVVDSAMNGVTINGNDKASTLTDGSGNAKVSLNLTKITGSQYQQLLTSGITVRSSIVLPNGVVRISDVHLDVQEAVNPYHLQFGSSKWQLDVNGDKAIVTVTLLDQSNQPVANQKVKLAANNGGSIVIATPGQSKPVNTSGQPLELTTDSNGNAFYSVNIAETGVDKELLLASGVELTATQTDSNGATTTQITRISTTNKLATGSTTIPVSPFTLRISTSKTSMNVRNDVVDVVVTVLDQNGGGVADKYVMLGLSDFIKNGTSIVGPSGLTTNADGQAVFKVRVDESARNAGYSAAQFVTDDLRLTAQLKETGYQDLTQVALMDIVNAVLEAPRASITLASNPNAVTSSADGVYYVRNMSASVTDFDGKPLANQAVTMDMTPLTYLKGIYQLENVIGANGMPVVNSDGTNKQQWVQRSTVTCAADPAGTAVTNLEVTNVPTKVISFVASNANVVTYTTDSQGKFDFQLRYPKAYANWVNLRIGASATIASLPNRTIMDVSLPPLSTDYSAELDAKWGPNLTSPYGAASTGCP